MQKTWLVALVLCGIGAVSGARPALAVDEGNIFSGSATTITLDEMKRGTGEDWRLVFVSPDGKPRTDVQDVNLATDRLMEGDIIRYLGAMPNVYYTQGGIINIGGESFLAAYRLSYTPEDLNRLFQPLEAKYPYSKIQTMSRGEVLKIIDEFLRAKSANLVMLNLHNVGSVTTLRVFDADEQLGLIEKRMGDEFDQSQAQRKQIAAEAARAEAARKAKAAAAKKGARPAPSKTRPTIK